MYTQVVTNCSTAVLIPIIKSKVDIESEVYTDGFKIYDGLVNFWSIAKTRLSKYRGISKRTFYLHLKECEFRFNHRDDDLYKLVLKIIRKNPL